MQRKYRLGLLFFGLVALLNLGLLACGDSQPTTRPTQIPLVPSAAVPPTSTGGSGQGFTPPLQVTVPPNQVTPGGAGLIGPTIGVDGQITVAAPTANPKAFKGSMYWVKSNNLWQGGAAVNVKTLGGTAVTNTSPLATTSYPALSPDGAILAHSFSPEPDTTNPGKIIIGQDIMGMDVKTKQKRLLVKRPEPEAFVDHPSWSNDGKYLYYSYRSPLRNNQGYIVGQKLGIARLEIVSGKIEDLIGDAREPHPTPDGKSVVYVGVAASNQSFEYSFKLLDLETKTVRNLLSRDQKFELFYFPRVSPDGQSVVVAAIGGPDTDLSRVSPGNPLVTPTPSNSFVDGSVKSYGLNKAALHGLPYDLWLVKLDGTGLRRLTALFEDQPMAAWTKDSKQIVFLAGLGLYQINLDGSGLTKISDEGSHGGFDYRE
jgi:WD40-like Beta Propeller Repeat